MKTKTNKLRAEFAAETRFELRPVPPKPLAKTGTYDWLCMRRRSRQAVGLTSIEILDRLYETEER